MTFQAHGTLMSFFFLGDPGGCYVASFHQFLLEFGFKMVDAGFILHGNLW
jgi:hypothetical protein